MVTKTILENGLIRWKSDRGLKVHNQQTGGEYDYADDLPNEERIKLGLEAYSYIETEIPIESEEYIKSEESGNEDSQTV